MIGRLRASSAMVRINDTSAKLYAGLDAETGHPTGLEAVRVAVGRSHRGPDGALPPHCRHVGLLRRSTSGLIGVEEAVSLFGRCCGRRPDWGRLVPDDGKVESEIDDHRPRPRGREIRGGDRRECPRRLAAAPQRPASPACGPTKATSPPRSSCSAAACGHGNWRLPPASACRSTRSSTTTRCPTRSRESPTIFPVPATPTARPTSGPTARRSCSARFRSTPSPGWSIAFPMTSNSKLLEPDWEKFDVPLREGLHRLPALKAAGFERFVNGPESFTPDSNFLLGETPELAGLFVATGFNSAGIMTAGGAGEVLARWIIDGEQPMDLWSADIRRFSPPAEQPRIPARPRHRGARYALPRLLAQLRIRDRPRIAEEPAARPARRPRGLLRREDGPGTAAVVRRAGAAPVMEYAWGRQNWFERITPPNTGPPARRWLSSTNRASRNSSSAAGTP